jgi:hypothetical protein
MRPRWPVDAKNISKKHGGLFSTRQVPAHLAARDTSASVKREAMAQEIQPEFPENR